MTKRSGGLLKTFLNHYSLHPWEYFPQFFFVPMCTHSMEFYSFYRARIYGQPCNHILWKYDKSPSVPQHSTTTTATTTTKSFLKTLPQYLLAIKKYAHLHFVCFMSCEECLLLQALQFFTYHNQKMWTKMNALQQENTRIDENMRILW